MVGAPLSNSNIKLENKEEEDGHFRMMGSCLRGEI